MSGGIQAIQPLGAADPWEAWQALLQASLSEGGAAGPQAAQAGGEAHGPAPAPGAPAAQAALGNAAVVDAQTAELPPAVPTTPPSAPGLFASHAPHAPHAAHHAHAANAGQPAAESQAAMQATRDTPPVAALPPAVAVDRPQAAAPSPLHAPAQGLVGDTPMATTRLADAAGAVLPMAPVLMTALTLQDGPELRWRVQDAARWRALFDDAGHDAPQDDAEPEPLPMPDAVEVDALPAWAFALLGRLRDAATAPASAAALRPALQAWRVGLPVLLASPAGLASLQPSRDAAVWGWRRWPARWRTARPTTAERWWAVRVGLGAHGRPRTLRDLCGGPSLPPGQVRCELRLDSAAAAASTSLAQWTDVLVQAPAGPSLHALLAARPSLAWVLCNQPLWPQETA